MHKGSNVIMKTRKIKEYLIFVGENLNGYKYKEELSKLIKQNFPEPFNEITIKKILEFSLDYYSKQFENICSEQTGYRFYTLMLWLHDQSSELRIDSKAQDEIEEVIGQNYFSAYRRVLKLILEEACKVKLVSEKTRPDFKENTEETFDNLMFIGDELLSIGTLLAEQDMIGDAAKIEFNKAGIYQLGRNHFFNEAFEKIVDFSKYPPNSFVVDESGFEDFKEAVNVSFGVDMDIITGVVNEIFEQRELEKWDALAMGFAELEVAILHHFNIPRENTEAFLEGLYLTKDNKIPISVLMRKPFKINRFLNKPILVWNVEDKDYCIIGKYSFAESIQNLIYNAFPWGKTPGEWETNPKFKSFLDSKNQSVEKMLLNAIEDRIKKVEVIYQLSVKNLCTDAGIISIVHDQCGEIDGIVINLAIKKIFIVESKHLITRSDMPGWYMDYKSFIKPNGFNAKIEKKIKWVKNNIVLVEQHFRKEKKLNISIQDFTVEGIFFINTPTFYMYYSPFRIYTFHETEKVLTEKYIDKTFTLVIDEADAVRTVFIKYPYFVKKNFITFPEDPYADYPVDKYGEPIIPESK